MERHSSPISHETLGSTPLTALANDKHRNKARIKFEELSNDADIPKFVKKYDAELRFPDKLMLLMTYVEQDCTQRGNPLEHACIAWVKDGTAFIIRNEKELMKRFLPTFFHAGKFSSFTRKLYRWGFRQKLGEKPKQAVGGVKVFRHIHFQRDKKKLLVNMQSSTVVGARRANTARSEAAAEALPNIRQDQVPQINPIQSMAAAQQHAALLNSYATVASISQQFWQHPLAPTSLETRSTGVGYPNSHARLACVGRNYLSLQRVPHQLEALGADLSPPLLNSIAANFPALLQREEEQVIQIHPWLSEEIFARQCLAAISANNRRNA